MRGRTKSNNTSTHIYSNTRPISAAVINLMSYLLLKWIPHVFMATGRSKWNQITRDSIYRGLLFQMINGTSLYEFACVFWNYELNDWSTDGCSKGNTSDGFLRCFCNHTTNFAALWVMINVRAASHIIKGFLKEWKITWWQFDYFFYVAVVQRKLWVCKSPGLDLHHWTLLLNRGVSGNDCSSPRIQVSFTNGTMHKTEQFGEK